MVWALFAPLWRWDEEDQLSYPSISSVEPQATPVLCAHPFLALHLCCKGSTRHVEVPAPFFLGHSFQFMLECHQNIVLRLLRSPGSSPSLYSLGSWLLLWITKCPFPCSQLTALSPISSPFLSLFLLNSWQEALSFITFSHFCQVTLWVISPNK